MADTVTINSRISEALNRIGVHTDERIQEFAGDVTQMARALLRDKIKNASSGNLEASIKSDSNGMLKSTVRTDAQNRSGYGYGAAQEWGLKTTRKMKGKHFMKRAIFGMIKRWKRGERWRP